MKKQSKTFIDSINTEKAIFMSGAGLLLNLSNIRVEVLRHGEVSFITFCSIALMVFCLALLLPLWYSEKKRKRRDDQPPSV